MTNLTSSNGKQNQQGRSRRVSEASVAPVSKPEPTSVAVPGAIDGLAQPQADPPSTPNAAQQTEQEIDDYRKVCQEQYDRYTSHLWDQRSSSQSEADKLVVAMAGTTLALSVGFLKDVVPLAHSVFLWLLFLSWSFLCASLISTLTSYHLNLANVNEHLRQCHSYFFDGNESAFDDVMKKTRITESCNKVSSSTFVIGLIFTLSFLCINIQDEHIQMNASKTPKISQSKALKSDPNTAPSPTNTTVNR